MPGKKSSTFKMKGHTLPGPFQKKTWPPGSEKFDVDKDVIEKEKSADAPHFGKSFAETARFVKSFVPKGKFTKELRSLKRNP